MRLGNQGAQYIGVLRKAPTVVTGQLALPVRHQGELVQGQIAGLELGGHIHQVVQRVAFDVELAVRPLLHQLRQVQHIAAADMARIGPRMHSDTRSPRLQTQGRGAGHAGDAKVAGIAHQGHFIQIDRQGGK